MIDVYSFPTPNGHKVHILLEELGLSYRIQRVDITQGDQFAESFLKISPNNKIPAIVDHDGPGGQPYSLFESGAILIYLANKAGQFLPSEPGAYYRCLEWLMFQMGGVGPMLGQAHHFLRYAPEDVPYAQNRYKNEANRLYAVLDRRLGERAYLGGDSYTVADIATWPWLRKPANQGVDIDQYPHVKRWHEAIGERPAVQRGLNVMEEPSSKFDQQAKENLFGSTQFQRR